MKWFVEHYLFNKQPKANKSKQKQMENIISKLEQMICDNDNDDNDNDDNKKGWDNWSAEEKKKCLELYLIICQNETCIYDLIYSMHGEDSWEDMFRDYSTRHINDKIVGVQIAINAFAENEDKDKNNNDDNNNEDEEQYEDSMECEARMKQEHKRRMQIAQIAHNKEEE